MAAKKRPVRETDKLREDANETAFRVLQEALGQRERTKPPQDRTDADKSPEAVQRGRKGGERGGRARATTLTPEQRREIAKKAAAARWGSDKSSDT